MAIPERRIPILIDWKGVKSDGFVVLRDTSDTPIQSIRRLDLSLVKELKDPQSKRRIEKDFGLIPDSDWALLRELLAIIDRWNAGDRDPIAGRSTSTSDHVRSVSGHLTVTLQLTGTVKVMPVAIAEGFTSGLSKARFVVWWAEKELKFAPGLYCPDIMTALYALVMWSRGTPGGLAICERCQKDYPRVRSGQRYCGYKCRMASNQKKYREKHPKTNRTTRGASTAGKTRGKRG
jgi:hypothetical protein